MDREQTHLRLKSLIHKFEANKFHYLSKNYLEEEVKIDFINPLFEILGWDIRNTKGLSPYEREVLVEKGETIGHPDYNFRIDGQTKFYVEAKAPHEQLHKVNHILQAKSYAWNTKNVFIVLLTDFEEFRLFDATIKPDSKNPEQGLIFELTYDQYLDNIDKLMLLSKEEVESGSIDKLILKDLKSKKLRIPVDKAFLEDLSKWREELAKDIYKQNIKELEDRTDENKVKIHVKILNEAVQKILNRLIFIRIAEDRKIIEPKSLLDEVEWWKAGGKRRDLHKRLTDRFIGWNQDFNGEILKTGPCDVLGIDSHLLAKIIEGLYFPKCPYRFNVIGVELLGSIYERYLGKTIRVTPKRVKIEEKPEVRKAGGVYYTPQYIVDYIVKNTVGKVIKGKTPKQIEKIKILDPACGSGSFLLTAFQTLIDYHLNYYEKHPEESGQGSLFPDIITDYSGEIRLSIEKKALILKNNIFGVDIDPQAVEIAMMSLYLKCLEGEKDLPRKKELLPSLSKNIRCGNSLISYDIFNQLILFEEEEKDRINPFDWNSKSTGFGETMEKGGFDVVIGNPPYVRIQVMKEWAPFEVEQYKKQYKTAFKKNYDIYVVFVEKGINILNKNGLLGYILPNKFMQQEYGENLRKIIAEEKAISEIINFKDQQVFEGGTTYTCLLLLNKKAKKLGHYGEVKSLKGINDVTSLERRIICWGKIDNNYLNENPWFFVCDHEKNLVEKLKKNPKLGDTVKSIFVGLQTSADKVFILKKVKETSSGELVLYSKALGSNFIFEQNIVKPLISGMDVKRYTRPSKRQYVIFPYRIENNKSFLIPEDTLKEQVPRTYQYFVKSKKILENREKGKMKGKQWHGYIYLKNLVKQEYIKICVPRLATCIQAIFDDKGKFYLDNVDVCGITLKSYDKSEYLYLLGLLNSKLLSFYLKKISTPFRGGFYSCNKQYLSQLPICIIDFNKPKEKAIHEKMVKLVDKMLELNKKKHTLPPSSKRDKIEREIQITDEKIDEFVYELYGITEKEKEIIEGSQ
ncbi:MAG: Eco57I restriction-modification methylase domain-containing protein [Candidatus Aminicenantes bacterium]|nr:Eco57I restriction-modification methylase domain-containing protein [Candidatus Aminicenantes bacterium]MBL7083876.1 Eco57I restriction-modification methylase domain-containing protein [Candidatus Aminicenantes bacterium]